MPQGRTALVPQPVIDIHWGDDPLAMPCPLAGTAEGALEGVFGALPPLSGALWDSLVMALCRAYTGLTNELAVITSTRGEDMTFWDWLCLYFRLRHSESA